MNKNILVIADQDTSDTAVLGKARDFMDTAASQVHVLAFVDSVDASDESISLSDKQNSLEAGVKQDFGDLTNIRIEVVVSPDIAEYCAAFCETNNIDLVIKTGHRSETIFYTPLDWQLLRRLTCPLVISVDHSSTDTQNILAAIDIQNPASEQKTLNESVVAWAAERAGSIGSNLHIAYCIEAEEPLTQADESLLMELEKNTRQEIEPKIRQLLNALGIDCKSILIGAGSPGMVISRFADELKADLVVMGSVGRTGMKAALLGNTAESVMHNLKTNLAIIHPGTRDTNAQ